MPAVITVPTLQRFAPRCAAAVLAPALASAAAANAISTPARVCAWLGQIYVESQALTVLEEKFNYTAADLLKLWPKHFPTPAAAQAAVGKPEAIAEAAYGGRFGNANPGDGWLYRGRGLIDLTFKDEYQQAGHWLHDRGIDLDLVATPALAADPNTAAAIAGAFWTAKGCNPHADAGDIPAVTRLVTGAQTDLAQRQAATRRAALIWN